jgi:opacity protein-like surface antigen
MALTFASSVAAAEEGANSINVSPLGLAFGSYNLTYERLTQGGHGFLVEGMLNRSKKSDASQTNGGMSIGYRWHWSGGQDSGFLGANIGYGRGIATGSITTTSSDGMATKKSFDVDTSILSATANVGRRFAFNNGLNITLRVGAGYGKYQLATDSKDPDAKAVVDDLRAFLNVFPIAVDGEISLGYIF